MGENGCKGKEEEYGRGRWAKGGKLMKGKDDVEGLNSRGERRERRGKDVDGREWIKGRKRKMGVREYTSMVEDDEEDLKSRNEGRCVDGREWMDGKEKEC